MIKSEEINTMKLFGVEIEVVSGDQQDWAVVDTTLGLGLSSIQETVKDHDDVDTSLRLSTGSPSCSVSRERISAKKISLHGVDDDDPVPPATQLSLQESNSNSNSDTSPAFLPSPARSNFYNNKGKKKRAFEEITDPAILQEDSDFVVYNPMPLRSYPPMNMIFPEFAGSSRNVLTSVKPARRQGRKKNFIPPLDVREEALPEAVMQLIHNDINGTRPPEFLYMKCLQEADIKRDQNRVLLTTSQNLMRFLNEDEREAVNAEGIELGAMDENGNLYELRLKRWPSVKMFVLNKEWNKLISYNQVNPGHWLHIWGYRPNNGELRLVIVFKKTDDQDLNVGSSSSA